MNNNLFQIVTPIVSILSIFISHYLGLRASKSKFKKDMLKHRYESVYVPYMLIIAKMPGIQSKPISNPNVAIAINEITLKNIHLLGKNSASYASQFYLDMLDYFEYCDGNPNYSNAETNINSTFIEMSLEILKEASHLSKELNLPNIALTFYNEILKNHLYI